MPQSICAPAWQGGRSQALRKQTGMCCSDVQRADLPANFDYSDVLGEQRTCIRLLQHATQHLRACMARGQVTSPA